MAKLSAFRINSKAIETGEWVSPGEEYGDLQIKVRGFTDTYHNAHQARLRRAAKGYGGDVTKLPIELSRGLLLDSLAEHIILDIRNLTDDAGQPITKDAFVDAIRKPDFAELVAAVLKAAARVGLDLTEDAKESAGNSERPSA